MLSDPLTAGPALIWRRSCRGLPSQVSPILRQWSLERSVATLVQVTPGRALLPLPAWAAPRCGTPSPSKILGDRGSPRPSFAPRSSLSRHRILPLSGRLRPPATSFCSPSSSPKLTTLALPVNAGPGCWLMCSGLILALVSAAVGPCAGSKPPPPNKLPPRCSLSLGLLLNLLRRHHRVFSGS